MKFSWPEKTPEYRPLLIILFVLGCIIAFAAIGINDIEFISAIKIATSLLAIIWDGIALVLLVMGKLHGWNWTNNIGSIWTPVTSGLAFMFVFFVWQFIQSIP